MLYVLKKNKNLPKGLPPYIFVKGNCSSENMFGARNETPSFVVWK